MQKIAAAVVLVALGVGIGVWMANREPATEAQAQAQPANGFAAVPGDVGSQDVSGPYEVVQGWPKDISTVPGNEKWTYGAGESVYAESPNRVYMLFRGELPKMAPPKAQLVPSAGPSISFPVGGLWRDATTASLPGTGGTDQDVRKWLTSWEGKDDELGIKGPPYRKLGVDAQWENCLVIVDRRRQHPRAVDAVGQDLPASALRLHQPVRHGEARVGRRRQHAGDLHRFSHDGKTLLQTIGTPEQEGADATHFNRPTFIDWLPDGTFFVSDGYTGTRVAKFDKDGKFLMDWGIKGMPPNETRPGYLNNVHGVAVDPTSRRVFVNDRNNSRVQIFDENGKPLGGWTQKVKTNGLHLLYIGQDRNVWTFDRAMQKMLKYDQEGHLLYAWGSMGMGAGYLWGVHGMHVDQEGNLYVAEVDSGRVQKFRPRPGANPAFLVAKPVKAVWQ